MSAQTLNALATGLRRASSRRRKSAHPTGGNGSSSSEWQTPSGFQGKYRRQFGSTERDEMLLPGQAENWPTPDTQNDRDGATLRAEAQGSHAVSLHHKAQAWATPRESEYKGTGPVGSKSHLHRLNRGYLDAQTESWGNQTQPAWIPCPDCDDYWCTIHEMHTGDCPRPVIDEWITDPYTVGNPGPAAGPLAPRTPMPCAACLGSQARPRASD